MKKTTYASLFVAAFLLASCADKMTDQHSAMAGGDQSIGKAHGADLDKGATPANTNGKNEPMAGGKVNSVPDTMWNQSSSGAGRPF